MSYKPRPRLPLAPALPYVAAEIDWHREASNNPSAGYPIALATLAGATRRTAHRWLTEQAIPERWADRLACALGEHPATIWGADYWRLATSEGDTRP